MTYTGYYGYTTEPGSKVHVVTDGNPICGTKPNGIFQWCAPGVRWDYIECKTCKRIVAALKEEK